MKRIMLVLAALVAVTFGALAGEPLVYGPFGTDDDVVVDKVKPTIFPNVSLTFGETPAASNDCVAVYRKENDQLCGLGKVIVYHGQPSMTLSLQVLEDTEVYFKGWQQSSGMTTNLVASLNGVAASETIHMPESGSVDSVLMLSTPAEAPIPPVEPELCPIHEDDVVGDKVDPTIFAGVVLTFGKMPMAVGDVVGMYRTANGSLCGYGEVIEQGGAPRMTLCVQVAEGTEVCFRGWQQSSGMTTNLVASLDGAAVAETILMPKSGSIDSVLVLSTPAEAPIPPEEPERTYEMVPGEKMAIDTGLVGYKAVGLPSGLKYDSKTGKITGAAKAATAEEGVVVKFTKSGAEDEELTIVVRAEEISVGCEGLSSGPLPAGVVGAADGMDIEVGSEGGTKSVSVTKLPSGMKYDKKSGKITGAPTKAGDYEVVLTVTTVYGNKETVTIPVSVTAMPMMAVGKFNGFVSDGEDNLGTFSLTTTDAGKLTAKVVTAAGSVSFSGTSWDAVEDGVYQATLKTKKGDVLTLTLDSTAGWNENQLSGEFTTASRPELHVTAQRNAFGKTWYFGATGDAANGWEFAYAETAKAAALTVTLKADGSTSIAGKLPNGTDEKGKTVTIKVSASGYANVGGLTNGAILADFAPVLTVNKVKKVLMISTNLWFDRKNEVGRVVGQAKFTE